MATVGASLRNAKAWDAEHPEQAAEYRALVAELEALTEREERQQAERDRLERALRHMAVKLERSGIGDRSLAAAQNAQETEALAVVRRWMPDHALTWLVLAETTRRDREISDEETAAEASWIARTLDDPLVDADAAERVLLALVLALVAFSFAVLVALHWSRRSRGMLRG